MPRSRLSLIDATKKIGREDRLTEILATVIENCPEFTGAVFQYFGLSVGPRYRASTQLLLADRSRIDMHVESLTDHGVVVSEIWSEHKLDAAFGQQQRERYRDGLADRPVPGRLIFVVRPDAVPGAPDEWTYLTWQELGEIAEDAGRRWAGKAWRQDACRHDAPAGWRFLWELLWVLEEEEELAMGQALDRDDVAAFAMFHDVVLRVTALLERGAHLAGPLVPAGEIEDDVATFWQQFAPPRNSWLARLRGLEATAELIASPRDHWSAERHEGPVFGAGVSFDAALHPALSGHRDWAATLAEQGFSCELWGGWVRVYRTRPIADVVASGDTIAQQAACLGTWARDAVGTLMELGPGDLS